MMMARETLQEWSCRRTSTSGQVGRLDGFIFGLIVDSYSAVVKCSQVNSAQGKLCL